AMATQVVTALSAPAEVSPDDQVRFVDSHRPAIDVGLFTFRITHRVEIKDLVQDSFGTEMKVAVGAPRYTLAPGDIRSVLPPAASAGDFSDTLPNIIFNRPTLPWERSAAKKGTSIADELRPPWLALLMLEPGEGTPGNSTVGALKASLSAEAD